MKGVHGAKSLGTISYSNKYNYLMATIFCCSKPAYNQLCSDKAAVSISVCVQ